MPQKGSHSLDRGSENPPKQSVDFSKYASASGPQMGPIQAQLYAPQVQNKNSFRAVN